MGLAGIFLEMRGLIWAAIGVLVVGFLLRFLPAHRWGPAEEPPATSDGGASEDEPPGPEDVGSS